MAGPFPYPESPHPAAAPQPLPPGEPYPPSSYPGMLPPPVHYPGPAQRRRLRPLLLGAGALVVVAAVVLTIVFARQGNQRDTAAVALTPATAQAAIQDYLDALSQGKDERIAQHTSCGLFDAIKDRQVDMSLANLASDAFRRQFSAARVDSIDKIVYWSANQAQVLFTMKAKPARGSGQGEVTRQSVAQVLIQDQEVLVCSYLPRTAGPF